MLGKFYVEYFCFCMFLKIVTADDGNLALKWFPYSPTAKEDKNPSFSIRKNLYDEHHNVVMGVENPNCDDAKSNVENDWDFNPINYTCFTFNRRVVYRPRTDVQPIYSIDPIPLGYSAQHKCMNELIEYREAIPTFGTHRPLWAKYGEYVFLPPQRWVHNLEHGAVIMLYHPCANKNEVNVLRTLVTNCLYRHIITPYNLLSPERPLALVAWGHKLEMSKVYPKIVVEFITRHALKGPEETYRDGQYDLMLAKHADIVSDLRDRKLCELFNVSE